VWFRLSRLCKFGKYKVNQLKYFSIIFLSSRVMDELCTTHLVRTGIYEAQGSCLSLAYSTVFFASGLVEGMITMTNHFSQNLFNYDVDKLLWNLVFM
jgi:hypothetical protein